MTFLLTTGKLGYTDTIFVTSGAEIAYRAARRQEPLHIYTYNIYIEPVTPRLHLK
jgi:hypothetical protein